MSELPPLDSPSIGSDTILDERTDVRTNDGDHDRFAHYVKKNKIVESAITGKELTALCGKKWIPGRNPDRYPICPTCKKIYDGLPGGDDEPSDNK
ncbi:MAG: hypothetical protein RLZZ330_165 [Actinomycetota bacterium]